MKKKNILIIVLCLICVMSIIIFLIINYRFTYGTDSTTLIKFNGDLYELSNFHIDYVQEDAPIGTVDKLTDDNNIPQNDLETNKKYLLNSVIFNTDGVMNDISFKNHAIVVDYDNGYLLFVKK